MKLDRDLAVLRREDRCVVGVLGSPGGRSGKEGKREREASAASKHERILKKRRRVRARGLIAG